MTPSRIPQGQPQARLGAVAIAVRRHGERPFRRLPSPAQRTAFEALDRLVREHKGAVVLDAGCGTGASSEALARVHPDALVIGVDKSLARIERGAVDVRAPDRVHVVRADLIDLWLQAAAAGWRLRKTYLLYPNPWPKPAQLSRRWHAHPVFPALLATTRCVELRTNWAVYAEEFAYAVEAAAGRACAVEALTLDGAPLSPFERKYAASGHPLWRVDAALDP
jgi:tRNA G46 methylase TrmB